MSTILDKLHFSSKKKPQNDYRFNLNEACPGLPTELTTLTHMERKTVRLTGELASSFKNALGAHKWHHYFPIYEQIFAPLRDRPISLLEIGVYRGASLNVWSSYFHPQSKIVGIDIDPSCTRFENTSRNIHVRIGQQQDPAFLAKIVDEFGPFDLVIDDGSHMTSHMIASFGALFGGGLKAGGIYFAEDTHSNFWPHFRNSSRSFMDVCFGLVECMHLHYSVAGGEPALSINRLDSLSFVEVPKIVTLLEEIRFFDSIVVIKKALDRSLPVSQHW